jgi:hypothetical protein
MATPEDADPRWLELLSLAAPAGHAQNEFFASACADPVVLHVVNRSSAAGGIVQCRIVSIVTILYGREINDFAAPSPTRVAIKTLPWLICFASASVPCFACSALAATSYWRTSHYANNSPSSNASIRDLNSVPQTSYFGSGRSFLASVESMATDEKEIEAN